MKRNLIGLVFVFLLFLLQSTVFQYLSFAGIVPNLLMIFTAAAGFMRGEKSGLVYGFVCGCVMCFLQVYWVFMHWFICISVL